MIKRKYIKPAISIHTCRLESDGFAISSASFTTGGQNAIPEIEDWQIDTKQTDWEISPPQ